MKLLERKPDFNDLNSIKQDISNKALKHEFEMLQV